MCVHNKHFARFDRESGLAFPRCWFVAFLAVLRLKRLVSMVMDKLLFMVLNGFAGLSY